MERVNEELEDIRSDGSKETWPVEKNLPLPLPQLQRDHSSVDTTRGRGGGIGGKKQWLC